MTSEGTDSQVEELLRCQFRALVARAFVELAIPDCLAGRRMTVAEVGTATHSDRDTLTRLFRAAEATGLCDAAEGGYALTPTGEELRSDGQGNAAGWLLLMTSPWTVRAWERLADAVRSGRPSFPEVHGQGFWDYVGTHPEEAGAFDGAMTSGAAPRAEDLRRALDWSSVGLVVDVGGGQGLLMTTLLNSVAHLRGMIADRAEVIATPLPAAVDLCARVDLVAADFFEEVPGGGDVYILSRILHDWSDSDATAILRRCREAMGNDARLCVLEQIAPDFPGLSQQEQFDLAVKDLNMLVLVGGRERTLNEYTRLLAAADLEIDNVYHGTACDVIQAKRMRAT